jgi:hypothetical protein
MTQMMAEIPAIVRTELIALSSSETFALLAKFYLQVSMAVSVTISALLSRNCKCQISSGEVAR